MALKVPIRRAQLLELEKKPMARALRASLFQREIRVRLSSAASELLLDRGQILSEGQVDQCRYFGSTMITLDVRRLDGLVSDSLSSETASRFGVLAAGDPGLLDRARGLGVAEARRLAAQPLADPEVDVRVRTKGPSVQIDLDVEADLARGKRQ